MISRNVSAELPTHDSILFKSSERIDSPILTISLSNDLGIPEEIFVNYNIVSDNIFIETMNHYYFVPYAFENGRITRRDKTQAVASIDLSPYNFSSILYVERERSYYCFLSKGVGQQLFFNIFKYNIVENIITQVYDSTQTNGSTHENFIHNTTNIDWNSFYHTFSHNQKLDTFLVTYSLKDEEGYPVLFEHRFKVFQGILVEESIRTNVYTIGEPPTPQQDSFNITFEMNQNTKDFCGEGGSLHVGDFTFDKPIAEPFVFYIAREIDGDWVQTASEKLTKNLDGSYSWNTKTSWGITNNSVYVLQYFISSKSDSSMQAGGGESVYFVNNTNLTGASIETIEQQENYGQTSDKYYLTVTDKVSLSFGGVSQDVTMYCTFDSKWSGTPKPTKEQNGDRYICTLQNTYTWSANATKCTLNGCAQYFPLSKNTSIKYPKETSVLPSLVDVIYRLNDGSYRMELLFDNPTEIISISATGIYIQEIDNTNNTLTCLYAPKRGEEIAITYKIDDKKNNVTSAEKTQTLEVLQIPSAVLFSLSPTFDNTNLETYMAQISEQSLINGGYFNFNGDSEHAQFMPDPSATISVLFGERSYQPNIQQVEGGNYNISFSNPIEVKYGEALSAQIIYETKYGSFYDNTVASLSNDITLLTEQIDYELTFEKDDDSSIYGKINDESWTSVVQPNRYTKSESTPFDK